MRWLCGPGLALALIGPAAAAGPAPDFDRDIAPLFVQHCLDCHQGAKPRGGLDLSHRRSALEGGDSGPVLVPGKPDASRLWDYVRRNKMPPKKPLAAADKELIERWIAAGAAWGSDPIDPFRTTTAKRAGYDWWALQSIKKPQPPAVKNAAWCRNPIDAFVLQRLEAKGLAPAPEADARTLARRLSFDLLGLPPDPREAPGTYEQMVERCLHSPHYGERWARHWLDVVRFGESNGFEFDEPRPSAWPYRDWVMNALNRDLSFAEFARLQLAGDVLRPGDPAALTATGFLVAGAYDSVGQAQQSVAMKKVVRQDELEDMVGVVGQAFLGLTIHCARCHDHKFDPVRQEEYYRLTAALAGVRHGERTLTLSGPARAQAEERLTRATGELETLEKPVRLQLAQERKPHPMQAPAPLARWDFRTGLADTLGNLKGLARGGARLTPAGLKLDGKAAFVVTVPLKQDLTAKTLEAWVTLDSINQRGGAVMGVQTHDGGVFDAIVFGEKEPGQWMAGSNFFVRWQSFGGPVETRAGPLVHVAIVYDADGTITAYRNGKPYGRSYRSAGVQRFRAGEAEVVFGLRHAPPEPGKLLAGVLQRAHLYDRALTPAEVAASAGGASDYLSPEAIADRLPAPQRARYSQLRAEIAEVQALLTRELGKVYAVSPRPPETCHLLIRGNPAQPGPVVSAGGVRALAGLEADFHLAADAAESERRRHLAAWITHPKNPLFARVIVNRLWHHHFGVGLVDTPNDFGFNGGRPSHPELLDYLAAELIEHDYSLKHLHRLILCSATYRQASVSNPAAARLDAGNRLLWRRTPRRLEAEMVRDTMLAVADRLDHRMGGPGYRDVKLSKAPGTNANLYVPADDVGPDSARRTLYRTWFRGGRSRLLDAFDCPDPSATAPSRPVTTTPLQALAMMNNALILRMADASADRVAREAGSDPERQVRRLYLLAYSRPPDADELALAVQVVRKQGLAVLARAIFNSNEFLYVD